MKILKIIIICFLGNITSTFGATHYVAVNGNDTNTGTINAPFASVQKAHDIAAPGDQIILRGGSYFPTSQTVFSKVGQSDKTFILKSYPGEVAIINGQNVPDGDINNASTFTWSFIDASHWRIENVQLTNGRGAGVYFQNSNNIELDRVVSSYNGKRAARSGHGFMIWTGNNIHFINCDGHHNANHRWRIGEDQLVNQYQHGDGWRIFSGANITFVGCRAWHNLDDGWDFTQSTDAVEMINCWAAYSGLDDAVGSITGTPNLKMSRWEGDGIKFGYENDTGKHRAVRCLSWNNNSHGWTVRGGPYEIYNSGGYNNVESAYAHIENQSNVRRNSFGYKNTLGDGGGANVYNTMALTDADFVSVDDTGMLGPRQADGSLPETNFLSPTEGGLLVDSGTTQGVTYSYEGNAPDIGPFEFRVLSDTDAPIIAEITVTSETEIVVTFNERITPITAAILTNYSLNNGGVISAAVISADARSVTLTTSTLIVGLPYLLTSVGVEDLFGNPSNDSEGFSRTLTSSWIENFEDDVSDGSFVDTGTTAWTISGADTAIDFAVRDGRFESHATGGEAVWSSEIIDISTATSTDVSVDLFSSGGLENVDYVKVFYKLNGGSEVEISSFNGAIPGNTANVSTSGLTGTSLQIIIKTKTSGYNERYFWDNINVVSDIEQPGVNYANWYFDQTGAVPELSSDTDGDGISAIFEYAYNLDPNGVDQFHEYAPKVSIEGGRLKMTFNRNANKMDLIYEVMSSSDLVTWTTIAKSESGGAIQNVEDLSSDLQENGSGDVTVEVTEKRILEKRGFLRLKISISQP